VIAAGAVPSTRFVPSRDALAAEIDGLLIVLDLRSERYYVLDEVATAMWNALVEVGDRDGALERLRARYDVDTAELERDLEILIARLTAGGFARWVKSAVDESDEKAPAPHGLPPRRGAPFEVRAWSSLASTLRTLRREGFAAAYRRAALAAGTAATAAEVESLLARGLRAFARAENLFLMPKAPRDCFPRSIALFRFLRAIGVPVEHRIGVNRYPFAAHAWVEWNGRVLSDHPGSSRGFTTIARLPR